MMKNRITCLVGYASSINVTACLFLAHVISARKLTVHEISESHKTAIVAEYTKSVNEAAAEMKKSREAAFTCALETAYFCAVEELSNCKYKQMIDFLRHRNDKDALYLHKGSNAKYTSPDIFNQLISSMCYVHEETLKADLRHSKFVGTGVDESTDRSQEKGHMRAIPDGKSATSMDAIKGILVEFDVPMSKVVGSGTDGASAMAGHITGVTALVAQDNPHCAPAHCVSQAAVSNFPSMPICC